MGCGVKMNRFLVFFLVTLLTGCNFEPEARNSVIDPESSTSREKGLPPATYGELISPSLELSASQVHENFKVTKRHNCQLPKASRKSKVYYYYNYESTLRVPLYYAWANSDGEVDQETPWLKRPGRIDVVVTETKQPVYLVLGSYSSVFWNVQLADGVRLDGVSVVSYDASLISNIKRSRSVGFYSFRNQENRRCYSSPQQKKMSIEARVKAYRDSTGKEPRENDIEYWQREIDKSQKWFDEDLPKLIGKRADVIITRKPGGDSYSVLVGPTPPTPMKPQPIDKILYQQNVVPFWGDQEAIKEKLGFTD